MQAGGAALSCHWSGAKGEFTIAGDMARSAEGENGGGRNSFVLRAVAAECDGMMEDKRKAGDGIRTHDVQLGNAAVAGCKANHNKALHSSNQSVCTPVCTETKKADDPDLAHLINAWPDLSPPIRAAMLAMVASATGNPAKAPDTWGQSSQSADGKKTG